MFVICKLSTARFVRKLEMCVLGDSVLFPGWKKWWWWWVAMILMLPLCSWEYEIEINK